MSWITLLKLTLAIAAVWVCIRAAPAIFVFFLSAVGLIVACLIWLCMLVVLTAFAVEKWLKKLE